jgi:surface carbohydrate biosynthesis protein
MHPTNYKILFPIETTSRELIYKLVLCTTFSLFGYECYIGSKDEIKQLIDYIKPFAYFDKGYHADVSDELYKRIKSNYGIIFNLDEEGGVDFKDSSTIASRYPDKLFEVCDLVFLWGQNQYDFLKQCRNSFNTDKVVVSGHPRFELLKPAFQKLYQKEVDKLKNLYQQYILFNTNMGFGNNIWGDAFVREHYGSRIKHIETVIEFDKKKIDVYISLIKRLSLTYNGNIILRPHPEENKDIYIEAFKGLENVKVIFDGTVIPWILGAEVMIHPDCTTGIESMMLGKKPISYLPNCDKENCYTYLPVKLSYQCKDEDEVVNLIMNRNIQLSIWMDEPLLNDYFSFHKDSSDIIVTSVHEYLSNKNPQTTKNLSAYDYLKSNIKEIIRPVYHKLLNRDVSLYQNKLKGLDNKSVTALFYEICLMLDVNNKVKIQNISSNLYRLKGVIR